MPDQSTAATEHAITQDLSALPPAETREMIATALDVEFPIVLRGYDREAVDDYVRQTSRLLAELQATRSPEAAIRRALERVGEEVSGILRRAHETADQITAQSRIEADDRLQAAIVEAREITARAKAQLRDLDTDTDRIWAERHRIVEDMRALSGDLTELADRAAERFPPMDETAVEDETKVDEEAAVEEEPAASGEPILASGQPMGADDPEIEPARKAAEGAPREEVSAKRG